MIKDQGVPFPLVPLGQQRLILRYIYLKRKMSHILTENERPKVVNLPYPTAGGVGSNVITFRYATYM